MSDAQARTAQAAESPARAADYLANERTFLAWLRTGVAFMGVGVVLAKFGLWLRLADGAARLSQPGLSTPLGAAIVLAGGGLCLFAGLRYLAVNRALRQGRVYVSGRALLLIAVGALLVAAILAAELLLPIRPLY